MSLEIERKWILQEFPELPIIKQAKIEAIYISTDPEVRLRRREDATGISYKMAVKGPGLLTRFESEEVVSERFWNDICQFIKKTPILKDYRAYDYNGYRIEVSKVDNNWIYAEVEFPSEAEAKAFQFPIEGAIEVTEVARYKMKNYWKSTRC